MHLHTGVTLFSSLLVQGESLSRTLESIGSPSTRIVIESGEEGEEGSSSSEGAFELLEQLLISESPESLICAATKLVGKRHVVQTWTSGKERVIREFFSHAIFPVGSQLTLPFSGPLWLECRVLSTYQTRVAHT